MSLCDCGQYHDLRRRQPSMMSPIKYIVGAASAAIHLLRVLAAALGLPRRRAAAESQEERPASLLRPVCGIDNFAAQTLASSFDLDSPDYEIIFCAAQPDDPAVPLLQDLI